MLSFGKFPFAALGGGLDTGTGLVSKAVLVRIWHTPLNDARTGGHICAKYASGAPRVLLSFGAGTRPFPRWSTLLAP